MLANSGLNSAKLIMEKRADVEAQTATFDKADMTYTLFCAFAVFLITPGIGLFYGGTLKRKNMVQVLFQTYMVTSMITIVWYLIGYSLANSESSSSVFLGNTAHAALYAEEAKPTFEGGNMPTSVMFTFNTFFPVATVQIFLGAIGERGRILPSLVVGFIWVLVVYCPEAYWSWGANGWLGTLGALDFAGGSPVHVSSGVASLVYSYYIGPRGSPGKHVGPIPKFRGHSVTSTFIGVTLIWAAWFCFNSGTLLAVNARTGYIFTNTMLASSFGCLTFVIVDKLITGKYSLQVACEGVILGLVNITPSCGFYWPWAAVVTTVIDAVICRLILGFNRWTGVDDYSKSFVVHGVGGIIGGILTGIFASAELTSLDGASEIDGGWIDGHWVQIGYQIADVVVITAWTAVLTYIICFIVDHIPGLKLRATPEQEEMGMDLSEMAETLDEFGNDYEEFFMTHAAKLRLIADHLERSSGVVEVLDGSSPHHSNSSAQDIQEKA